jgi:hypothetical protein
MRLFFNFQMELSHFIRQLVIMNRPPNIAVNASYAKVIHSSKKVSRNRPYNIPGKASNAKSEQKREAFFHRKSVCLHSVLVNSII